MAYQFAVANELQAAYLLVKLFANADPASLSEVVITKLQDLDRELEAHVLTPMFAGCPTEQLIGQIQSATFTIGKIQGLVHSLSYDLQGIPAFVSMYLNELAEEE